jgi:hypothetical protein
MVAAAETGRGRRSLCLTAVMLAAGVTLYPTAARAAWISSGPFGGAAEIVRVAPGEPGLVLAATANGLLYQSHTGGASWTRLPFPAQFAGTLHALEADPRRPGTWYADGAVQIENQS